MVTVKRPHLKVGYITEIIDADEYLVKVQAADIGDKSELDAGEVQMFMASTDLIEVGDPVYVFQLSGGIAVAASWDLVGLADFTNVEECETQIWKL